MNHETEKKETDPDPLNVPVELYHEAQADGVPYEDANDAFSRELPKSPFSPKA